jgi:ribonucleoside-triphosphate reductase (formate)
MGYYSKKERSSTNLVAKAKKGRKRYSQSLYESLRKALMGVSATHLDWTMVPYVRKSFYKHFLDGVKYCQDGKIMGLMGVYESIDLSDAKKSWIESETPIENQVFVRNEKAYAYAVDQTRKEVYQAVEGLFHNLKV